MTLNLEPREDLWFACVGFGVLLTCFWFAFSWKRMNGIRKTIRLTSLMLPLLFFCGAFGAKLIFILCRIYMISPTRLGEWLWPPQVSNASYYGGVAGVCLGVFLAAKLTGERPGRVLNCFAPAGAFLAGVARFAEAFLAFAGVGSYLDGEAPFPLAVRFAWDQEFFEYYLAVFIFEGLFSIAVCAVSLCRGREPDRFRRTLFYLFLPQVLFESMRIQSITWLFVRVEQLMCFIFCESVLVFYALKTDRRSFRNWVPALTGLVICGLLIAGEFALDGKISFGENEIPNELIYCGYSVLLCVLAWMEHIGHRNLYGFSVRHR